MSISREQCEELIGHCWVTIAQEFVSKTSEQPTYTTHRPLARKCQHCGLVQERESEWVDRRIESVK